MLALIEFIEFLVETIDLLSLAGRALRRGVKFVCKFYEH